MPTGWVKLSLRIWLLNGQHRFALYTNDVRATVSLPADAKMTFR